MNLAQVSLLLFIILTRRTALAKSPVKRIQCFTEQPSTFLLGEMLFSFDHLLRLARPCSVLLSTVLLCLMENQISCIGHLNRACPVFAWHYLVSILKEYCVGPNKAQEMLAEMFSSFDHPELSSCEQG